MLDGWMVDGGTDCTGLNGEGAVRVWFPLAGVMDGE